MNCRFAAYVFCLGAGLLFGILFRIQGPPARVGRAAGENPGCVPGDANGDGSLDVSDAVYLLYHLFVGGKPPVPCAPEAAPPSVAVVVRHAEKATGTSDPGLTPEGQARAERLATMLSQAALDRLIASELRRTQETVAPLAELRQMEVEKVEEPEAVVDEIRRLRPGEVAVVCHHSYTIPSILQALGVENWDKIPVSGDNYDNFLIVLLGPGASRKLLHLKY